MSSAQNPDLLRPAVKAILEEAFENARPLAELMAKAMREEWDDSKVYAAMADLYEQQVVDLTKNYDYYTNKILALIAPAPEAGDA